VDTRKKWSAREVRDAERKIKVTILVLQSLVAPSPIPRRGTLLADLVYRAEHTNEPDGYPNTSLSAAPQLTHPTSQPELRSHPGDAKGRKHEAGYKDDTSTESDADALMNDVCDECGGAGVLPRITIATDGTEIKTTDRCRECRGTGRKWIDPLGDAVDEIMTSVFEMVGHAVIIGKRSAVVIHAGAELRGVPGIRICNGCHNDVERGERWTKGFCQACATAWYEWHKEPENLSSDENADRARFGAQHKRHDGHVEAACELCAELALRPNEDWRADMVPALQAAGVLPADRRN
jgi:hypothetical protein